jgi:hypothetical protein
MAATVSKIVGFTGLFAAAAVRFAMPPACALEPSFEETAKLKNYGEGISSANPAAAKEFLKDAVFKEHLKLADPERAAALTAGALALDDLVRLLDNPWRDHQEMELSRALALRIDFDKPLEKTGIGPEPETLLLWMERYGKYSNHKKELVKKAIRQFEVVFGTITAGGKAQWDLLTIRERNAFLEGKADESLDRLLDTSARTDKAFQDQVRGSESFKYLDPAGRARYERYLTQLAAAEAAKAGLTPSQLDDIKDQPIEQQLYLLGGLFDKSFVRGGVSLERKVDSVRQSRPGETLSFQNNRLLADMLRTALPGSVKGTVSGDKALEFYNSGAKLEIAIESCRGCYAKYEPSSAKIILDSEMIQQYLRVNNLTAEEVLRDKGQVAALASYAAPIFMHEAAHQMQHSWAEKANLYKPYTQEDEMDAVSMEALYTTEKMRKDERFKDLMLKMEKTTLYAQKRVETMDRFNEGPAKLEKLVRQIYYYGTPSFDAASAQILSAVSAELERRKTLDAAALAVIEKSGADLGDAMAMTAPELAGSVSGIRTPALKKVRDDLLDKTVYTNHYAGSSGWASSMLAAIRDRDQEAGIVPPL